jgi:hypothetical protein
MTRKDYKLIAESFAFAIVLCEKMGTSPSAIWVAIGSLSADLVKENPRFDRERFTEYIEKEILVQKRKEVAA